ncbi:Uu.00g018940.m01.CDS01 [Anthostomella pinea]|uniref:Uu.00g018940.m01.CDS01 n=1 Tax=Anthostomella pinea TaxID=933095 RepID=A0AAI8YQQ5_9PEZI|nr:Uu.00g018940.m01.CDS01 [Anthostomella pinea]
MALNNHLNGSAPKGYQTFETSSSKADYNPALLLNPRGYVPSPTNNNAPQPSFSEANSTAPMEFQFATVDEQYGFGGSLSFPKQPSEQAAPHVSGYGNMIERMNNVEDRPSAPQKRRRLETEDSAESTHGFAAGGSGMMGQYMKDKQHEFAQRPANRPTETVDLTDAADNGDVVVIQQPKDEEVCYGMIQHAKLNCDLVPSPKPGAVAVMGANYWPIVKVVLKRKHGETTSKIEAYDHTRQIVGRVDPITSGGLATLLDSPRMQIRTTCRILSRLKEPNEEVGKHISKSYPLDLVVYGPRKNARAVGTHLGRKNIWLRKPFVYDNGVKYENPQDREAPRQPAPAAKEQFTDALTQGPQASRTVEEIRSEVMGVFDSLTKSEDLPEMTPGPLITTELLKHQKQGLHFMTRKEQPRQLSLDGNTADSFWQIRLGNNGQRLYHNVITGSTQREQPTETLGGILADMMGLGKTLSILSLVASSLQDAKTWSQTAPVQPRAPPPKKNGDSSKKFNVPTPEPLGLTRLRGNSRATLLVCPLSTITNWEEQIKAHIQPNKLSYYIYHGPNRIKDAKKLAQYDLVMTTYGSVGSEVAARSKGRGGPFPLEEIGWFRIVLDEAHMIREQSTLQFKAICRLQASRRWAVTGTPVQNKLDDLAALLAFLRLKPFDEKGKFSQFITAPFKICDPEIVPKLRVLVDSVTLRRLKDKIDLPPRTDEIIRLDFDAKERKLYSLFEQSAQDKVQVLAAGREKMLGGKTYIHILQSILRLRLISAHGRDLLNDTDLELVQGMTEDSAIDLDSDEDDEKPALAQSRAYEAFALMQETNNDLCISCQKRIGANGPELDLEREDDVIGYMTTCFHLLCTGCITAYQQDVGHQDSGTCPFCRAHVRFAHNELRKSKTAVEHEGHRQDKHESKAGSKDGYIGYSGPHTKTRALVEDLLKSEADSKAKPDEPPYKSVVFSAWTSHLDLIQLALDKVGIHYTRLDGKMTRIARTAAMDAFREDKSVHVILVSISAGGLGLNLTTANSVYVMEPQYNPAAEAQAVDRVHRLGQKRPVRTVRYIMRNSIEEKMLILQDKKTKLANLSMDRARVMDKAEAAKQKLMDLRDLFK